jgi:hypothetical protein
MMSPFQDPKKVGVKVTLIVQLAAALRLAGQLLVWAKSPVASISARFTAEGPTLVTVMVWGELVLPSPCSEKERYSGDRLRTTPVPCRLTTCGLSGALELTLKVPFLTPVAVGVKVTEIVQIVLGTKLVGQLWVREKSPAV